MQADIQILMAEKKFEGCGGLTVNDRVKVMIVAQAAILLQGDVCDYYPGLRNILVYPGKYRANVKDILPSGVVREGSQWRSGESWSRGNIVLAWDEVQKGASVGHDGQNLVLHEFSHQIDTNLGITSMTEAWVDSRVEPRYDWIKDFAEEWMDFLEEVQSGRDTLFDTYGTQNAAEFFAVTTESFIEQHTEFRRQSPTLYKLMTELYNFNPEKILTIN